MSDARRSMRKRTFLAAYVKLDERDLPVACLIRDVSQTGARVLLEGADEMPKVFDLHINGRDKVWRVETVWRRVSEVGVRLLSKIPYRPPGISGPPDMPRTSKIASNHMDSLDVHG